MIVNGDQKFGQSKSKSLSLMDHRSSRHLKCSSSFCYELQQPYLSLSRAFSATTSRKTSRGNSMHEAGNSQRACSWIQTVVPLRLRHAYKHQHFASVLPLASDASYCIHCPSSRGPQSCQGQNGRRPKVDRTALSYTECYCLCLRSDACYRRTSKLPSFLQYNHSYRYVNTKFILLKVANSSIIWDYSVQTSWHQS